MTREDAERIADTIRQAIWATSQAFPEMVPGLKLAGLLIADRAEKEGNISSQAFLDRAGIEPTRRARPRSTQIGLGQTEAELNP